ISRFADVWEVLSERDGRITTTEGTLMFREQMVISNGGVVPEPGYDPLHVLSDTESPVHEQIRQAIGPALRRSAAVALEGFVGEQVRGRLDELVPAGRFNVTTVYAGVVAAATMCYLFGIPLDQAAAVRDAVFAAAPGAQNPELQAQGYARLSDLV